MARRYARLRAVSPVGPGGRLVVASAGFEASAQDAGERVRQPPQWVVALGSRGRAARRRRRGRPRMGSTRTRRGRSARRRPRAFSAPARRPLRACRAVTAVLLPGARVVGLVAAWFLRALPPVRRRGSSPGSPGAAHHPPPTPRISSPVPATQPPQRPAGQPPATQRNRAHASTQPRHPRQRSTPPATAKGTIFRQRPKPTSHKRSPARGHQAPSPPDSGPANPHQETGRTVGMTPQRTSRTSQQGPLGRTKTP